MKRVDLLICFLFACLSAFIALSTGQADEKIDCVVLLLGSFYWLAALGIHLTTILTKHQTAELRHLARVEALSTEIGIMKVERANLLRDRRALR